MDNKESAESEAAVDATVESKGARVQARAPPLASSLCPPKCGRAFEAHTDAHSRTCAVRDPDGLRECVLSQGYALLHCSSELSLALLHVVTLGQQFFATSEDSKRRYTAHVSMLQPNLGMIMNICRLASKHTMCALSSTQVFR
jgi:hypothetical protein